MGTNERAALNDVFYQDDQLDELMEDADGLLTDEPND
jgi:hypothetical protein